jgi:uncharacterized protein YutE (UPF0331/DUF86 family)
MSPGNIDPRVIIQRAAWVRAMIQSVRELPLQDKTEFLGNKHHVAAAESYLRRSLEALFDIGRHILVKKFAFPATEYKEISQGLAEQKVLFPEESGLMRQMAGYRNRMVHFYHEISPDELYDLCQNHLAELSLVLESLLKWVEKNQPKTP